VHVSWSGHLLGLLKRKKKRYDQWNIYFVCSLKQLLGILKGRRLNSGRASSNLSAKLELVFYNIE
jgi:hypothetical protein